MRFDDDAQLDTSNVEDISSGGGRSRGGMVAGGGAIGIIVMLIALILGVDPGQINVQNPGAQQGPATDSGGSVAAQCKTGKDANERVDCLVVAVDDSTQNFWTQEFARRGGRFTPAKLKTGELGRQAVRTGCGTATAAVGPFYCPADMTVYIDTGFFQELQTKFGAQGGPFAQAYVVAHEYGHHVQNLTGAMRRAQADRSTGPQSAGVRLELQADCYAGVWAHHAASTPDARGNRFIEPLTEQDIAQGLDAAAAVGDDRIQEAIQGRVSPESWTHGSASQRQQWFKVGYSTGDMARCDTFSGRI